MAIAALAIGGVCLICPWRTVIGGCIGKADVNEGNQVTYGERALTFPTDYDRENPLTRR